MSTWILILTIVAPSVSGGSSIASVPGFKTGAECIAAGNDWIRSVPPAWAKVAAVCVQQ